jgi:hypothetical protein
MTANGADFRAELGGACGRAKAIGASPKVVVLGSMCRLPVAGVVYQILHYMIGLQRLGFDPYYVEWHGNWVEDPAPARPPVKARRVIVAEVMRRFGFGERWACQADQNGPGETFGALSGDAIKRLYADAVALFNVTGAHFMNDDMRQCPRRLYVETDPGIPQIRAASGDPEMLRLLAGHTHFCTFAENIANSDCLLPPGTILYRTTRQPVVLDIWANLAQPGAAFTTIARWRKAKEKAIEFRGERYRWNKDLEFEPFIDLPARGGRSFELALSDVSSEDRRRLEASGWSVIDAIELSASVDAYHDYIAGSAGEFTIAKDQYVRLRTGWFSDRSACYLAAGRPVITQDTGFGCVLPTGAGLFSFQSKEDVLAALDSIAGDYARHARFAREIAREYFDAEKVLGEILDWMGVETPIAASRA